ncbi:MAG: ABC transporter permease subunit [Acidobacteriota bacterium]|nr:ABC transporter permease subunit [Acidobacteriota bacterium]
MLIYKAWLETRFRFFIGVAMTLGICAFFVVGNPLIVAHWKEDLIYRPELYNPPWLFTAMDDYPFFIHHFLFQDFLQKVWVLFAILIGFGGISRETAQGAAGFTLSLPVSRNRLMIDRTIVGFLEITIIGFLGCLAIPLLSFFIGKSYPLSQVIIHGLLLVGGGCVFYALSLFLSALIQGEYIPAFAGIGFVSVIYFLMQPYADGAPEPKFLKFINITKTISGVSQVDTLNNIPWLGLIFSLLLGIALFWASLKIIEKRDY